MQNTKIIEMVEQSCRKYSDRTAVRLKDNTLCYGELYEAIEQLSDTLMALPQTVTKPIGLYFKNCPEFIVGYYGLVKAGITAMLIDHSLKAEELMAIVRDCHLGGFLLHKREAEQFALKEHFSTVLQRGDIVLCYNNNLEYDRPYEPEKLERIISCRFSSGTTGVPKCMKYTQDNVIAAATNWKQTVALSGADRVMCVANYTHGLAFNTSMLAPILVGAEIHLFDSLMPKKIARYIHQERITVFVAFPVLYQMMGENNLKSMFDMTSLRMCVSSGTVLHSEVKQKFKENVGIYISDLYGVAETGLCILNNTDNIHTVGRGISGVDIAIMDDDCQMLPRGEEGQIAIKSGSMARGYYNFPGLFEERVTEDQYYLSGDIAVMDEEGYVFIKGRKQDFVDIAGKKVDPKEVEEILYKLPVIKDLAVFGSKNPATHQEVLCAAIVSEQCLKKHEITDYIQEKLASYKIPQKILFLDELPRNSSGKVLRRVLADMAFNF